MHRLVEYLNTGETIAFVGAGVPRELGIPAWAGLADELMNRLPADLGKRRSEAERLHAAKRYAELCGWIARNVSDDFLYSNCSDILKDTGRQGKVSEFIARFPFKAVFTTNFDDSLARHFKAAGRAVSLFSNSRDDLEAVDVDSLKCLVKVHGDFEHLSTMILTDAQYSKAGASGDFNYLRIFLQAYFASRRILIIGFSLSDPDINFLLEQVAQNLRRKTPIFAIVADATPEDCAHWKVAYNLDVLTYRNSTGTHRELVHIFDALSAFLDAPEPRRADPELDLKRAQSLYLWSRFITNADAPAAQVDALKSVLLFALAELTEDNRDATNLEGSVRALVGLADPLLTTLIGRALQELIPPSS